MKRNEESLGWPGKLLTFAYTSHDNEMFGKNKQRFNRGKETFGKNKFIHGWCM